MEETKHDAAAKQARLAAESLKAAAVSLAEVAREGEKLNKEDLLNVNAAFTRARQTLKSAENLFGFDAVINPAPELQRHEIAAKRARTAAKSLKAAAASLMESSPGGGELSKQSLMSANVAFKSARRALVAVEEILV